MSRVIFINIVRFVVLVLLQVLLLNKINLGGYLNPYVYVLFIILLPFETPGWLLLLSSFFLGLSIDLFSGTIGIHTAAATFMGYTRPFVSRIIGSKKEYEPGINPGINDLGFIWFLTYSLILVFLHHFLFFFLEVFRIQEFFTTMWTVILSTLLSTLLIILIDFLFKKNTR